MFPLVIASAYAKKRFMYTQQLTLIIEQIMNQGKVHFDTLLRWTAVSAIQASSAPLYDLKHSGNKMFETKTIRIAIDFNKI